MRCPPKSHKKIARWLTHYIKLRTLVTSSLNMHYHIMCFGAQGDKVPQLVSRKAINKCGWTRHLCALTIGLALHTFTTALMTPNEEETAIHCIAHPYCTRIRIRIVTSQNVNHLHRPHVPPSRLLVPPLDSIALNDRIRRVLPFYRSLQWLKIKIIFHWIEPQKDGSVTANFVGQTVTYRHLHTLCRHQFQASENDNCIFCQLWRGRKIVFRARPELKFENYESMQQRLRFSGVKKGAKNSFHGHCKSWDPHEPMIWDNFARFRTNCANLTTYIGADPSTCWGFFRQMLCCVIKMARLARLSEGFFIGMAGNKNQDANI